MTIAFQSPIAEVAAAQGCPYYLGSYDATTTSKTNGSGVATPFNATGDGLGGKVLLVFNDGTVDIRILPVATAAGAVTVTRNAAGFGVLVPAGGKVTLRMSSGLPYLAVITVSSTANVDVWELV